MSWLSLRNFLAGAALLGAGGASPLQRLLAALESSGENAVFLSRISGATVFYKMFQHLSGYKYFGLVMSGTLAAGNEAMRVAQYKIFDYWKGYSNGTTPALTNSGVLGPRMLPCSGVGITLSRARENILSLTTPSDTLSIAVNGYQNLANGAMFLVTIDGDPTLASLLPTAQDLVTGGSLDASALVGGGGTLNPTDRIYDNYTLAQNINTEDGKGHLTQIATFASAGAHTVRFTQTAYANVSSGGTFSGIHAILAAGGAYRQQP